MHCAALRCLSTERLCLGAVLAPLCQGPHGDSTPVIHDSPNLSLLSESGPRVLHHAPTCASCVSVVRSLARSTPCVHDSLRKPPTVAQPGLTVAYAPILLSHPPPTDPTRLAPGGPHRPHHRDQEGAHPQQRPAATGGPWIRGGGHFQGTLGLHPSNLSIFLTGSGSAAAQTQPPRAVT